MDEGEGGADKVAAITQTGMERTNRMSTVIEIVVNGVYGAAIGAFLGLVPFLLGRFLGKPGWGMLGLVICTLVGMFEWRLSIIACIVFAIVVFASQSDYAMPARQQAAPQPAPQPAQQVSYNTGVTGALNITCLAGPLRGQVYPVVQGGLLIGRSADCAVRLPDGTPGVSRQHCAVRWQQGVPVLVDLGSAHGTFLGTGQRLPPQYPIEIAAGTRFYLADTNCLFQVTVA